MPDRLRHHRWLVFFLFVLTPSLASGQTLNDGPIQVQVRVRDIRTNSTATDAGFFDTGYEEEEYTYRLWARDAADVDGASWIGGTALTHDFATAPPGYSADFNSIFFNVTYPGATVPRFVDLRLEAFEDESTDALLGIGCGGTRNTFDAGFCCGGFLFGLCLGQYDDDDLRCNADPFLTSLDYRLGPACSWYDHGYVSGSCPANNHYEPRIETYWRYLNGTTASPLDFGTVTGAVTHANSNSCYLNEYAGSPGSDVRYRFQLSSRAEVTASLCDAGFDTVLTLLDSGSTVVATNDNFCGTASQTVAILDPGTYFLVVDGATAGATGAFTLSVTPKFFPIVSPAAGLSTTEAGSTDSFSIALAAQPASPVTIALSSSDPTEASVPAGVTFTTLDWSTPKIVTVTGVSDDDVDGNQPFTIITGNTASSDPLFDGIAVPDVTGTNADLDTAGVIVTPVSGLSTTEGGGTGQFAISLTAKPSAAVTVSFSSNDTGEATVAPPGVTFTDLDWSTPKTVTVTGVNDDVDDGNQPFTIVTANTVSTDGSFDGLAVADVTGTNADDDTAGALVAPTTGLSIDEGGGQDDFTIVLTSQPLADVTIALGSSDPTEGSVAPPSVTFLVSEWGTPKTVTLTGVDDLDVDGSQPVTVLTGAAVSSDPAYNGMAVPDVAATNLDDDIFDDQDGDGVLDGTEDSGPNGGDGNGDGVADSTQSQVTTLPAANGAGTLTVVSTCALRSVAAVATTSLPPPLFAFPYGLVEFRMSCSTASMTVLYHGPVLPPQVEYQKYGPLIPGVPPTAGWYTLPGVVFDTTVIGATTTSRARFTLTDGQLGDDTAVDGEIVDQGGPGVAAAIPSSSEWVLLALLVTLAVAGVMRAR